MEAAPPWGTFEEVSFGYVLTTLHCELDLGSVRKHTSVRVFLEV